MVKDIMSMPYLAGDNPDGPVLLLFDYIPDILASARKEFKHRVCGLQIKQHFFYQ
jgi:fucokinase